MGLTAMPYDAELWRRTDLCASDKLVLVYLEQAPATEPVTVERIAAACGLGVRTAYRCLAVLELRRLITRWCGRLNVSHVRGRRVLMYRSYKVQNRK
jgi:hypothetical protein